MKNNITFLKIKQKFNDQYMEDIPGEIEKEFHRIGLDKKIRPGMKIAITAGSRGIDRITEILQSIIKEVKKIKADPFIVTAMGSHGGATAEGQREVLSHYGITEKSMGVPIKATMDTMQLDYLENGLPVYFDRIAYHADGIIAVNRVKVHTAFKGKIESGLHKILAVGLGNHHGAKLVHSLGVKGLRDYMVEFAKIILKKAPIIAGFGILENGYDKTFRIKAANPDEFAKVDSELLEECKKILASFPVKNIDLLVVQEMGKNISGTGMDTNIVGSIKDPGDFEQPEIKKILVLDLTEESQGNAIGVGIADMITEKLYKKIDFKSTNTNAITATFLDRARIPIVFPTEQKAIETGLDTIWNLPGIPPRIIIIKNTLKLDEMYVSKAIWEEIKDRENVYATGEWESIKFDPSGRLLNTI
ncbi:MAG TPA: lactate racemase domain-containing protein [Atribacterota bacterium]|nr:lactate racemase domain-containing protein [Atribacterota bacterium]